MPTSDERKVWLERIENALQALKRDTSRAASAEPEVSPHPPRWRDEATK